MSNKVLLPIITIFVVNLLDIVVMIHTWVCLGFAYFTKIENFLLKVL